MNNFLDETKWRSVDIEVIFHEKFVTSIIKACKECSIEVLS